jgi:uncharacterized membrane protein SpoIIM required for sporulation
VTGRSFRWLLLANVIGLLSVVCCGALIAIATNHAATFASPRSNRLPVDIGANAMALMTHNGRVWLYTVAGTLSFGAGSLFILLTNGLRLGFDIAAVARGDSSELVYLIPHGLPEFAAFTLAACASEYLGLQMFATLFWKRPFRDVRTGAVGLAVSAALLIVAGVAEAIGQFVRQS